MSKLSDIRNILVKLNLQLIPLCGDKGLTVDDPEYTRKLDELGRINETLRLCIRDLNSARHGLAAQQQGLWKIPFDKRFAAAASTADRLREANELIRLAGEIQRLAEDILGRICSGNEMEGFHTIAELIGHATGHEGATEQPDIPGGGPAYVPHNQTMHASPEAAVIMAYVAIRGLVLIGQKIAAKIKA
jgi:hypothetical protein